MTSVPQLAITSTSVTVPTEAEILAGVQADLNTAFGGGLNPALETPQGQIATSLTQIIATKNSEIANLINQFDPSYADGRFQDAIAKIYFLTRKAAVGTKVNAICYGLNGTVIPAGATAKSSSTGDIYSCTIGGTISSGSCIATFENNTKGAIACGIGDLNIIYQRINGWESITNSVAGDTGRLDESRADFEARRLSTITANSANNTSSMRAAALAVEGVVSALVLDNPSSGAGTINGVTLPAYNVYACVQGGNDYDVAYALASKKSASAPWKSGNRNITVFDKSYPYPYKSYNVLFTRPTIIPIYFAVNISTSTLLPANIAQIIQGAIINVFAVNQSIQIGATVFASLFYDAVRNSDSNCNVVSIKIAKTASPTLDSVALFNNEYPSAISANITVAQV